MICLVGREDKSWSPINYSVKRIEKLGAKYRYEVNEEEWWIDKSIGTKMTKGTGRVVDNETGEVLGEATGYVLFPKWYGTGRSLPAIHCGSPKVTGMQKTMPFATGLKEKTLMPGTHKNTGELK